MKFVMKEERNATENDCYSVQQILSRLVLSNYYKIKIIIQPVLSEHLHNLCFMPRSGE
jgi:hypothetical protein